MYRVVVDVVSLFLAGILAGEELVIRYGVRGPLAALDDRAHIQFRHGLIRSLRVLVPAMPAFVAGIAAAALDGTRAGVVRRTRRRRLGPSLLSNGPRTEGDRLHQAAATHTWPATPLLETAQPRPPKPLSRGAIS